MPEGCEKMSKQGDAAYAWFLKGYNCSQSVVAAFAPQLGLTEETALRLSAGFGAGIGRMREVCGAFCGVVTVLSMVYADPTDPKDKSRIYALVQQAAEQYRRVVASCRKLQRYGVALPGADVGIAAAGHHQHQRTLPEMRHGLHALPQVERQRTAAGQFQLFKLHLRILLI